MRLLRVTIHLEWRVCLMGSTFIMSASFGRSTGHMVLFCSTDVSFSVKQHMRYLSRLHKWDVDIDYTNKQAQIKQQDLLSKYIALYTLLIINLHYSSNLIEVSTCVFLRHLSSSDCEICCVTTVPETGRRLDERGLKLFMERHDSRHPMYAKPFDSKCVHAVISQF